MIMILKLLSKGEKRDKMKRTIQTLAILIAMTLLAVWMVGCGGEEEVVLAALTGAAPPEGSEIAANQEITLTFDEAAFNVTVNGVAATGSGKSWKWKGEIPEGAQTLSVAWENEDASETGSGTVSYTVLAADTVAPEVTGSTPANGDKDLNPEDVNNDGIEVKFSEAVKKVSAEVTVEGDALKWTSELSDDGMTATLIMLPGGDVPYEAEIVVIITAEDPAGNKLEGHEITFTTAAKEE
jgi:hypothetical protein